MLAIEIIDCITGCINTFAILMFLVLYIRFLRTITKNPYQQEQQQDNDTRSCSENITTGGGVDSCGSGTTTSLPDDHQTTSRNQSVVSRRFLDSPGTNSTWRELFNNNITKPVNIREASNGIY
jgi:hypothetical protein